VNDTDARGTLNQPPDDFGATPMPVVPKPPIPDPVDPTPAACISGEVGTFESWLHAPFLALQFLTIMPPVVRTAL